MQTLALAIDARGVAHVTMNRPEVFNAFNETMIAELGEAFDQLGNDPAVRLIVLAGAGKAFSAGADKRASEATHEWTGEDERSRDWAPPLVSCPVTAGTVVT